MAPERTDRQLIDEAARWLARMDAGTASEAEFAAWRDADPRRAVAFAEVASAWRAVGRLRGLDEGESLADGAPGSAPEAVNVGRRRILGGGLAAAVAIAGGGATMLLLDRGRRRVRTVVGERRTVQLPDGSSAELNTDSRISWSFDKVRALWLEQGEVAVTVVDDASRQFLVHAGGLVGRLQQGRYNVRLRDNGPQFISLAGQGLIAGKTAAPVRLQPLQTVVADRDAVRADAMTGLDAQDVVAWQSGEIIFRGMPLGLAAAEFNRYLQNKIVVDPAVASIRLGGRFQVDDLPSFLSSLHGSFGIRVQSSERGYLLTAA